MARKIVERDHRRHPFPVDGAQGKEDDGQAQQNEPPATCHCLFNFNHAIANQNLGSPLVSRLPSSSILRLSTLRVPHNHISINGSSYIANSNMPCTSKPLETGLGSGLYAVFRLLVLPVHSFCSRRKRQEQGAVHWGSSRKRFKRAVQHAWICHGTETCTCISIRTKTL